jgi:uncharacterized protein
MTDIQRPKIEFPCEGYSIRVMGEASESFRIHVIEVFELHVGDFSRETIDIRASSTGRYESVRVAITATGIEQLQAIFDDLKKHPAVQMVL